MKELRVDIGGSNRGFQIATEQTKRMANDLQRSMDSYSPETFKGAWAMKDKYGAALNQSKGGGEHHSSKLKEGIADLRREMSGAAGQLAAGFISEEAIRRTIEYGEQVEILSKRTGTSTDTIQKWGYALKMSGSDMSALAPFFTKLATAKESALEGNQKQIASFRELGVSVADLKSKRLEDIGMIIAKTFEGGDAQKLIGSLREVGGRGAGEFVAAFKNGFEELTNEASALGVVMSKETIEKLTDAEDQFKQLGMQLMAGFAPFVTFLSDAFTMIYNTIARIAAFAGGFSGGGWKGGARAVQDYDRGLEAKKANREKRKGAGGMATDESIQEGVAKVGKLEAAQKAYREELERCANAQTRLAMELGDERDLKQALAKAEAAHDEVEALKLKTELLRKQKEIGNTKKEINEAADKAKEGPKSVRHQAEHVDSLAAMGGIGSTAMATSNPLLEVNRSQLSTLKTIAANTNPKPDPFQQ